MPGVSVGVRWGASGERLLTHNAVMGRCSFRTITARYVNVAWGLNFWRVFLFWWVGAAL
jgi:hypothetical protein